MKKIKNEKILTRVQVLRALSTPFHLPLFQSSYLLMEGVICGFSLFAHLSARLIHKVQSEGHDDDGERGQGRAEAVSRKGVVCDGLKGWM